MNWVFLPLSKDDEPEISNEEANTAEGTGRQDNRVNLIN